MWFRILLLFAVVSSALASRILLLAPSPSKSHSLVLDRLTIELAKKGHEVTHVTYYKHQESHPNLKQIIVKFDKPPTFGGSKKMDKYAMKDMSPFVLAAIMPNIIYNMDEMFLQSEQVKDLIKSDDKYDVVIGEIALNEAILAGFSYKFKAPLIAFGAGPGTIWSYYLVGNPSHPAYIPEVAYTFTPNMSLKERFLNSIYSVFAEAVHNLYHIPMQDQLMREHFGNDLPPLRDIAFNTSLLLLNTHPILGYPKTYGQNVVEVGGIHIEDPKPLPEDLQKFLDDSKDGAILFSMGSSLQSSMMPPEKIRTFLNAFSRLKQNVLWKFETDDLPDRPKNVKILKWLPQRDILAHPNLKLFITHGGYLSTTEALYRGVPVIGIPIYGDQPSNMKLAEYSGNGISLDFNQITSDSLYETINEVLTNPRYRETVKRRSAIFRDNPKTALDTAIYWIEYVIRHNGAPHLKSAALNLTWYQYYLLDVIFIAIAIISTASFVIFRVVKLITNFLTKKTNKCHKKKTN